MKQPRTTRTSLALLLLIALCASASTVGAAQPADQKAPVTIAWWYRGNGEQADTLKVQDAMNEMLKTYEGLEHVSVQLNCHPSSDYNTQVTLGLAAGQQIDILNTVSISFADHVAMGTYIPLDEYISQMPELSEALPEWLLEMGKVNGKTYMIPHYQQAANMLYFCAPKVYMDKYGDLEKIKTTLKNVDAPFEEKAAVLAEYVRAVREGEGDAKYAHPLKPYHINHGWCQYYDAVAGSDHTFRVEMGSDRVVFWPFEEDTVKAFEIAASWYEEGLLPADPTINIDDLQKKNMLNDMSVVFCIDQAVGPDDYMQEKLSKSYGFEVTVFALKDQYYVGQNWGAGGDGVTVSSKNPKEAIRFIEAMNIERGKELYNTVVYGIEGLHYEKLDENHIKTLGYEGTQGGTDYLYSAHKWIMGNTFNAYANQAVSDQDIAIIKAINEGDNVLNSRLTGFVFNTNDISNEFEQVMAVHKEYMDALYYGSKGDGWEAYYNEYKSKLNAAKIDNVLASLQKQLDDFLNK